jgi:hypothetical protein
MMSEYTPDCLEIINKKWQQYLKAKEDKNKAYHLRYMVSHIQELLVEVVSEAARLEQQEQKDESKGI